MNKSILWIFILIFISCSKVINEQVYLNISNGYDIVSINNINYYFFNPYKGRGNLHLKGSLHNHTDNSINIDGYPSGDSFQTALKFKNEGGYDFYAYTDHNFVTKDPKVKDIIWMGNSLEVTHVGSNNQHLCVYNLPEDYVYIDCFESCQDIIEYYRRLGAIVSYAHPDWLEQYQSDEKITSVKNIQFVEIFNSTDSGSERAFALLQDFDSFVFGVGVDDYHYSESWIEPNKYFNKACVYAYANCKTKEDIWTSLLSGAFYSSKGATMDISCNDLIINIKTSLLSTIEILVPDQDNPDKYQVIETYENVNDINYQIDGLHPIFWFKVSNHNGTAITQAFKIRKC